MRGRAACIAAVVTTLVLTAAPAMALETKPTTPPTPVEAPPPSPYIESVRYAGGNGDVTPDPGERLKVFFSLRNTTDQTMRDVTGTLVIKESAVTVVDGTASWPDIGPGTLQESTTPFVIQISDTAKRAERCVGGPIVLPAPGSDVPIVRTAGRSRPMGARDPPARARPARRRRSRDRNPARPQPPPAPSSPTAPSRPNRRSSSRRRTYQRRSRSTRS